jgi:tryptophan-rich sensory protein
MILYFVMLGLNVLWSGLFFRMARPGAAFGAVLAEEVVTLAALIVFWNIGTLPGALLVPVLLWTGYIALRSLLWWRHGRQFRPVETEGAVPSPHLAA